MDILLALREMGFTEYEAKVYLALIDESPATGYQVSKVSSVPRSMVYETLRRLHARGAVLENVEGRTTLYRPLPPEVLLDRSAANHHRLVESLRIELEARYAAPKVERPWSITGRDAVRSYAAQMISRCRRGSFSGAQRR